MKTLFYYVVEMITEWITGIDNSSMKLLEVSRYVNVSDAIATVLNMCVVVIILASFMIVVNRMAKNDQVTQDNA